MTARKRKRAANLILAIILAIGGLFVCGSILQQIRDQALLAAIKRGDRAGVLRLLDSGADPNVRSDTSVPLSLWDMVALFSRRQPLAQATTSKHSVPALSAYIQQYQNTNVFNVTNEDTVMTEALLRHGAKVDATDYLGQTALGWAVGLRRNRTARLLLDRGADPNALSWYATPTQISRSGNQERVLLEQHGPEPLLLNACRMFCGRGNDPAITRMLIEHGASVNATELIEPIFSSNVTNRQAQTVLMAAVFAGDKWAVKELLKRGAKVNFRKGDSTILRLFDSEYLRLRLNHLPGLGDPEIRQMLVKAGAKY